MALPWHIPLSTALRNLEKKKQTPEQSLLKHFANINIHENPTAEIMTGIMCDIGEANRDPSTILKLISAGMTIGRLVMDDIDLDDFSEIIQSIRQAVYQYSIELEYVFPLALVMDIYGPDVVTGELKGGPNSTIDLVKGASLRLTNDISWKECGNGECLYIRYDDLSEISPRDVITIDALTPTKVKLIVMAVGDDSIECSIIAGGIIGCKMGVEIIHSHSTKEGAKGASLRFGNDELPDIKYRSIQDQVERAVKAEIDALLIFNTESAQDILSVKKILGDKGKSCIVFACIDTASAFNNIDSVIAAADGVYLDRTTLSCDLPVEKIFIAKKVILAKAYEAGKPCIVKAVLNEQMPAICTVDIANLVLDGTDVVAFEFNYNSPLKKEAEEGVKMAEQCLLAASIVCRHAEMVMWKPVTYGNTEVMDSDHDEPTKAIAITAAELANRANAVVIICITSSGRTAKVIAHALPNCLVLAVTKSCAVARQLRFWRGVRTLHYFDDMKPTWQAEIEARTQSAIDYCKTKRILRTGDPYIVVNTAIRRGLRYCDTVRLYFASARGIKEKEAYPVLGTTVQPTE